MAHRHVPPPGITNGLPTPWSDEANYTSDRESRPSWPGPEFVVSHPRDWDFIDPGTHLDKVNELLSPEGRTIALVSLAGAGKSSLAIEYCYCIKDQAPETWVFWIDASSRARIEQCCRDIADRYSLVLRFNYEYNIVWLVVRWLEEKMQGNWVLVLDGVNNVENAHFLKKNLPQSISARRPKHESIIVTTREEEVAKVFVEAKDVVVLDPMNEVHALALLERKLDTSVDDDLEDTKKLIAALGFMPLAIVQAAAYINRAKPDCSVRQYLDKLEKLNLEGIGLDHQNVTVKSSILSTWHISFDHIRHIRPSAASLLSLMSCAYHQRIPDFLVRYAAETEATGTEESRRNGRNQKRLSKFDVDAGFGRDVRLLSDYSLITVGAETFDMAEPVKLATQAWLKAHEELNHWVQKFVSRLEAVFPNQDDERLPRVSSRRLLPHVSAVLANKPTDEKHLRRWCNLTSRAGRYALTMANLVDAKALLEPALAAQQGLLGPAHDETFNTAGNVARLYTILKEDWRLETIWKKTLDSSLETLGPDHPRTRLLMFWVARICLGLDRYAEAETPQKQLVEVNEKIFGATHPDTLEAKEWLADIWEGQGRLVESETLRKELIETSQEMLGTEHTDVLQRLRNLGAFHFRRNQLSDAAALQEDVIEICRRVLGTDHQLTINTMYDLALTLRRQGREVNATALLYIVIWLRRDTLGYTHSDTKDAINLMSEWRPSFRTNSIPDRRAFPLRENDAV